MARLSRQNDELSKEVGRLQLLEEQRKGASAQPPAVSVEAPAPPRASPAEQSPPSRPPPKCYHCGGIGHMVKDCEKKRISTPGAAELAELTIRMSATQSVVKRTSVWLSTANRQGAFWTLVLTLLFY